MWRKEADQMRRVLLMGLGVVLAVLGPGCSTSTSTSNFEVKTDVTPGVDFSGLKTYCWAPATIRGAERGEGESLKATADMARRALQKELEQRGYLQKEGAPCDFRVSFRLSQYHTASRSNQAPSSGSTEAAPVGLGMSRSGSLTVSVWMGERDKPVWSAVAAGSGAGGLRTEEQIRVAVHRILAEFPPL